MLFKIIRQLINFFDIFFGSEKKKIVNSKSLLKTLLKTVVGKPKNVLLKTRMKYNEF